MKNALNELLARVELMLGLARIMNQKLSYLNVHYFMHFQILILIDGWFLNHDSSAVVFFIQRMSFQRQKWLPH